MSYSRSPEPPTTPIAIHDESKGTYGTPRVHAELRRVHLKAKGGASPVIGGGLNLDVSMPDVDPQVAAGIITGRQENFSGW